jgi:hypothetical protein
VARTAVARKLLILVYYGLRDGHIRCLAPASEAGEPDRAQPGRAFV